MKELYVSFADLIIKIKTDYPYMEAFCKDYLVETNQYDFEVKASENYLEEMRSDTSFADDYCESLSIYESIGKQIVNYNGLIMHGACIKYQDQAILFTARSGTGKTTHIKLWKQYFKDQVDIINGDKPIVRILDDKVKVYGTPYSGKEGWHKNQSAPLKAICFIKQGKENKIKEISAQDALIPLLSQVYIAKQDENSTLKSLEVIDELLKRVKIYELTCNISFEAVQVCFKKIVGE